MVTSKRTSFCLLAAIIITYLVIGTLYALQTPKWQVPDEPAHFNYIEYVALQNQLPILQVGDYPHHYLEEIKAARFPLHMSIASIRYESWQPPLYYSLAAVLYRLTSSLSFDLQFLALRLFSVVLGAVVLWAIYRLVREVFPNNEFLALAATAFAATVPMHLAMSAGINNDILAELLLLLIVWQCVRIVQNGLDLQCGAITGILLGLAMLTKTTIYAGAAVIATAISLQHELHYESPAQMVARKLCRLLGVFALAMLFATPWFIRNAQVYGNLDILVWQRHNIVVSGQLRTADLLGEIGLLGLLQEFALTTFRSFWAQFGWMGVLVDQRIYTSLALLSGLLGLGFVLFILRVGRGEVSPSSGQNEIQPTAEQCRVLVLLGASALLTLFLYLGYNVKFVQHQGRYLFSALGSIALGAALGLRELLQPKTARPLAVTLLLVSLILLGYGGVRGNVPVWSMLILLAGATLLISAGWLPTRWQWLPPTLLYVALLALDLICLFVYVVPALR